MATNTYVALDTVTVSGSSTSTIQFTGIPSGYTDLVVVANLRSSDSRSGYQSVSYTFNSTGSNQYGGTVLYGNGSTASSYRQPNESVFEGLCIMNGSTSGIFYTNILNIMNYSNTNIYKSVLMEMGNAGLGAYKQAVTWRNTAAITSIQIAEPSNLAWVAGSSATLYGIANADIGALATGGIITYDANYYYHTFGSNGTFTPKQSLTADVLVVAGGGSGGGPTGAGGGAGGVCYQAARSVTATGYAITVGGGGASPGSAQGNDGSNSTFDTITANGGGGGNYGPFATGRAGGSGGGGGEGQAGGTANQGTSGGATGYGNNGGAGNSTSPYTHGGGGGAGAAGNGGTGVSDGAGGAGLNTWSSWLSVTGIGVSGYIAGGGGGGSFYGTGGAAGAGGAGSGATTSGAPGTATANTGSGGGGGGSSQAGSAGASGVVIIRYPRA